jgi:hypothetical protein
LGTAFLLGLKNHVEQATEVVMRIVSLIIRLAGPTALSAIALAALGGVTPARSADYYESYERSYEYPPQAYPQAYGYERPREYRVVIYPVRRPGAYFYEGDPYRYRTPRYPPDAYPSRYEGRPIYAPGGYREFEEGVPVPPALVGVPTDYAPPYAWR